MWYGVGSAEIRPKFCVLYSSIKLAHKWDISEAKFLQLELTVRNNQKINCRYLYYKVDERVSSVLISEGKKSKDLYDKMDVKTLKSKVQILETSLHENPCGNLKINCTCNLNMGKSQTFKKFSTVKCNDSCTWDEQIYCLFIKWRTCLLIIKYRKEWQSC